MPKRDPFFWPLMASPVLENPAGFYSNHALTGVHELITFSVFANLIEWFVVRVARYVFVYTKTRLTFGRLYLARETLRSPVDPLALQVPTLPTGVANVETWGPSPPE